MNNDTDVMIRALQKERSILHEKILQLDRIIKRVKAGDYIGYIPITNKEPVVIPVALDFPANEFPKQADIKIQVIKTFDAIGKAVRLGDLQKKYSELSGSNYDIRENVRSLHRARLVRMIRVKDATRGMFWVKVDWLENGIIMDEFKPVGFDLIYKPENLIYE